MQKPPRTPS
ncbi:hypothetical protein MTR67_032584 [Solanum verrucosum]|uniref:Uncharacterized protein n=1 Tax=Solanum verrucosum TaxID=315347 RepID=A0AAF0ZJA4_SOLVR|nr:hypothetical protein MTR67_032584 [Solanum verrucosum]